jgi:excisionase family DNA binding protein
MSKSFYTTEEAAAELGVTPARIRQMVIDGSLQADKFGRDLAIGAAAIVKAKTRKTKPGPEAKLAKQETGRPKTTPDANKRATSHVSRGNEASTGKRKGKK